MNKFSSPHCTYTSPLIPVLLMKGLNTYRGKQEALWDWGIQSSVIISTNHSARNDTKLVTWTHEIFFHHHKKWWLTQLQSNSRSGTTKTQVFKDTMTLRPCCTTLTWTLIYERTLLKFYFKVTLSSPYWLVYGLSWMEECVCVCVGGGVGVGARGRLDKKACSKKNVFEYSILSPTWYLVNSGD